MIRATTPTLTFTLPFAASQIDELKLTIKQGETALEFDEDDVTLTGQKIVLNLTQEQTKKFEDGKAFVQARILTTGDKVIASNILPIYIKQVLNEEVFEIG